MAINKQYLKLQLFFLHMTYEGTTSNSHRNQSYFSIFILIPLKFQVWSKKCEFEKKIIFGLSVYHKCLVLVIKNVKINFFKMKLENFKMKLKNFKIPKFEKYRQNAKILSY
jgi:hypothetical protein